MTNGHGIDQAQQRATSAQASGGDGDFIRNVRLPEDQDAARLVFLTLNDDVYSGNFHRIQQVSKSSKTFWSSVACGTEAGRPCSYCASQQDVQGQFMFWVFVRYVDYTATGEGRQQVQVGNALRYRETVNEVRLFQYAITHLNTITTMAARLGPLAFETAEGARAGRDWDWVRSGARGATSTTYGLVPAGEPTVLPKDLAEIAENLPDLEKVAFDEVRRVTQLGGAPAPAVVQVPVEGSVAPVAPPVTVVNNAVPQAAPAPLADAGLASTGIDDLT